MGILAVLTAIVVGLIVLLGYFFPQLASYQFLLLDWAILFAGMAAFVGLLNLLGVHFDKIRKRQKGSLYSFVLIAGMLTTFIIALALTPQNPLVQAIVLNGVIIPVETALLALLTVSLLYAAIRLLQKRLDVMSVLFILTAALLFLGSATLPFGDIPIVGTLLRPWVTQIWALGGARGILIGVSLGALLTGIRVLFGADRPYGGN